MLTSSITIYEQDLIEIQAESKKRKRVKRKKNITMFKTRQDV